MPQVLSAEGRELRQLKGDCQALIKTHLIKATHQIRELRVIKLDLQGRRIGLTAPQLQLMQSLVGGNRHWGIGGTERFRKATQQVTRIGNHRGEESLQMLPLPFEVGVTGQAHAEASDNPDRSGILARREIRKTFHHQAATGLLVTAGEFHGRHKESNSRIQQARAQTLEPTGTGTEAHRLHQLPAQGNALDGIQQALNTPTAGVEALLHQLTQTSAEQVPALLVELRRFSRGEQGAQHWIETLRQGIENADEGVGFLGLENSPPGVAAEGIAAAPLPQFDPIGEEVRESHLLTEPNHRLPAVEVEGFGAEQHQIQTLDTPTGEGSLQGGWSIGHGCDTASCGADSSTMTALDLRQLVREIPDFPKPGILFRDITPLMRQASAWQEVMRQLGSVCDQLQPDLIVGIESRGFIVGTALATARQIGFSPVRKPGKLPGQVIGVDYSLEYGTDRLEILPDGFEQRPRVLIVDDLLATGGTAGACAELVNRVGGELCGFAFVVELSDLGGKNKLPAEVPVESLIVY